MQRLPPLNALRTFEVAARLASFTKAAEELHVTQSAVSRQIRALEADLGVSLFRRSHRKVRLTSDGERLLPVLSEAFRAIEKGVDRLRHAERDVRIKVPPTFAIRWLIPRLDRFQAEHPEVPVRLTASVREPKLGKEPFDAGVRYLRVGSPMSRGDVLLVDRAIVVAAPRYLAHAPPLVEAGDLAAHQLLFGNRGGWDWRRWGRAFEVDDLPLDAALELEPMEAAIEAAKSGQGVALVTADFVKGELENGRLVAPLELPSLEVGAWLAVYARGVLEEDAVATFRDWLLSEAAAPE